MATDLTEIRQVSQTGLRLYAAIQQARILIDGCQDLVALADNLLFQAALGHLRAEFDGREDTGTPPSPESATTGLAGAYVETHKAFADLCGAIWRIIEQRMQETDTDGVIPIVRTLTSISPRYSDAFLDALNAMFEDGDTSNESYRESLRRWLRVALYVFSEQRHKAVGPVKRYIQLAGDFSRYPQDEGSFGHNSLNEISELLPRVNLLESWRHALGSAVEFAVALNDVKLHDIDKPSVLDPDLLYSGEYDRQFRVWNEESIRLWNAVDAALHALRDSLDRLETDVANLLVSSLAHGNGNN